MNLNEYASLCHGANRKWWFKTVCEGCGGSAVFGANGSLWCCTSSCPKWGQRQEQVAIKRNRGELLMLIVTEVAEAMGGERKNLMDDKLPERRMAEVELADTLIRIFDYAAAYGYDLEGAFREKMAFNACREDHVSEAKLIATGQQF